MMRWPMGDVPRLGENEGVALDRPQEGCEPMTQEPPDCAADVPVAVKDALELQYAGSIPPPEPVPDDVELV